MPLFPGYVFCRFDVVDRLPLLIIPGVVCVVGLGKTPLPVKDEEIEAIRTLVASGLPLQPWPLLAVGDRVRIEEGPLRGVTGAVMAVKGTLQLVVSVTLLQRSVTVTMDRSWLRPEARRGRPLPDAADCMRHPTVGEDTGFRPAESLHDWNLATH